MHKLCSIYAKPDKAILNQRLQRNGFSYKKYAKLDYKTHKIIKINKKKYNSNLYNFFNNYQN